MDPKDIVAIPYTDTDTILAIKEKIAQKKQLNGEVQLFVRNAQQGELQDDKRVLDQVSRGDPVYWGSEKSDGEYTIRMFTLICIQSQTTN